MTKGQFLEQVLAAATQSSKQSGMPALVTVAQAALESNWGKSRLSQEAHNYFGIKAHGTHARIQMSTHECRNGCTVEVDAVFAKYASVAECIQCRDGILLHGASYAVARQKRGDEEDFICELAKHWATDPKYSEKLQAVLVEVKELLSVEN